MIQCGPVCDTRTNERSSIMEFQEELGLDTSHQLHKRSKNTEAGPYYEKKQRWKHRSSDVMETGREKARRQMEEEVIEEDLEASEVQESMALSSISLCVQGPLHRLSWGGGRIQICGKIKLIKIFQVISLRYIVIRDN